MIMDAFKNIRAAWRRSHRLVILAQLCGMMLLINGCVSKDAAKDIAKFSSAVSLTTSNSASAYQLVENEHLQAQFSETLLNYDGGLFKSAFPPFLTSDQVQLRLEVLDGLQTYAERLSALMSDPSTNFDNDTTKLANHLNSLNQDLVQASFVKVSSVSSNDVAIFTAGVNALGHVIIKLDAQKACKEAITNMQAHMPGICGVFEKDLDLMRTQLGNDYEEEQRNSALYLKVNFSKLQPFQVRSELQRLIKLANAKQKADDALAGTKASVESLAAAHQALDKAFTKDTKGLASLISAVSEEARRASSYYNYLQTNN
jgi:two-component sensor histidine kinase